MYYSHHWDYGSNIFTLQDIIVVFWNYYSLFIFFHFLYVYFPVDVFSFAAYYSNFSIVSSLLSTYFISYDDDSMVQNQLI